MTDPEAQVQDPMYILGNLSLDTFWLHNLPFRIRKSGIRFPDLSNDKLPYILEVQVIMSPIMKTRMNVQMAQGLHHHREVQVMSLEIDLSVQILLFIILSVIH